MIKLTLIVVSTVVSYTWWAIRRAQARRRLRELDEGKRCVSCDGTELETNGDRARCLRCGHSFSLANLRAAALSESEVASITSPDRRPP